jgi:hypothetical protein
MRSNMGMTALCLAAAVLGSVSGTGHAAKFRLEVTRGADQPVCQAYANGRHATGTLGIDVCYVGRPFRSDVVSRPVVPVSTHVVFDEFVPGQSEPGFPNDLSELFFRHIAPFNRRYDTRLSLYFDGPNPRDWRGTPDQVHRAEALLREYTSTKLDLAPIIELDVDNDGRPEPVFFYPLDLIEQGASLPVGMMAAPIILSADRKSVDVRRTLRIFRSPVPYLRRADWRTRPDGTDARVGDFLTSSSFGVFRYSGKAFIDFKWLGAAFPFGAMIPEKSPNQPIRIFLADRGRVRQVCEFVCVEETAP